MKAMIVLTIGAALLAAITIQYGGKRVETLDARTVCINEFRAAVAKKEMIVACKVLTDFAQRASRSDREYLLAQPDVADFVARASDQTAQADAQDGVESDFSEWRPISADYQTGPLPQAAQVVAPRQTADTDANVAAPSLPERGRGPLNNFGLLQGFGHVYPTGRVSRGR